MEAIEEYEHAGCTIALYYDEDPMSPRDWSQLGVIVTWGREGGWGDEDLTYEPYDTDYSTARWAVRVRRERDARVVIPIRLNDYGSSGSEIVESYDRGEGVWDGANAVIMDTAKTREEMGCEEMSREEIHAQLLGEIEDMNTWAHGEVYGYVVEKDGAHLDSCWGFMGDDGLREAKSQAEGYAEDEERAESVVGFYALPH